MESLSPVEHEWAAPAWQFRLRINCAFAVSVLLHIAGLGAAVVWWPEPVSHVVTADRRLSIAIVAEPKAKPEAPVQPEAAIAPSEPAPAEKPIPVQVKQAPPVVVTQPVPDSPAPVRKSMSEMIAEAVREAPLAEADPAATTHGTVFDPRMREKIAAARSGAGRGSERGLTSYTTTTGATHVDLGDGRCLEVRREIATDNRDVWWKVPCPPGD